MGTKKPASPTAVVAAGRPLPINVYGTIAGPLSVRRACKTLPENVMRVNYNGRNCANSNALPHGLLSHEMVCFFLIQMAFLQLPPAAAASMAKLGGTTLRVRESSARASDWAS